MKYAEVAVSAPGGHRHTFTYSVPDSLDVVAGSGVLVPFGARVLRGVVTSLTGISNISEIRAVSGIIGASPLVSPERIQLALWIADYYLAPLFAAVALMLPPGFETKQEIKIKHLAFLRLNPDKELVDRAILELKRTRALKQAEVLEYLEQSAGPLPTSQIQERLNCNRSPIKALLAKGYIVEEIVDVDRNPLAGREFPLEFPFTFTSDQQSAWQRIQGSIAGQWVNGSPGIFLLHGVTGSGKTEVYLQALAETIRLGKKGICLVPEIALTPQIIDRFMGRFPGRVALLHSKLSLGQQYDVWHGIRRGDFDIVIGPRSAIFVPQTDLGLIIVDEEHEWAYKQSDKMPRYHARDIAVKLAALTGATLILGSATPSIETYYRAKRSQYQLIELPERITPLGPSPLPEVTIINMRDEFKSGNRGIFSRLLKSRIASTLERHEQVILFINRRGLATFVECMNCGYVPSCSRCSVALTYHAASNRLICHHCRRVYTAVKACPHCSSADLKYFGIGTETVATECRKLFPGSKIIRFDSDTVGRTREYEATVNSFRKHEADILVGTQIVAKGLNFPHVSLVGAVNADIGLNLPDFRSGERTFQLLCQVAGRAGRGKFAGSAVIQTYNPGYYAIKFAARHDYTGFYDSEIKYRRSYGYPPFNDMIRLVYNHANEDKCRAEADRVHKLIKTVIDSRGLPGYKLIGPVATHIARLRGQYQIQIILLGKGLQDILSAMNFPRGWVLDVDPLGMI